MQKRICMGEGLHEEDRTIGRRAGLSELRIRCFGGLDVRRAGVPVTGFESRKVRALLAYLVCHRDRAFTREHLATLLWPEKSEDSARRNLRQALYNLKTVLANSDEPTPILAHQGSLQLAPGVRFWLDVTAFEEALALGLRPNSINPHHLAGAARLYQGEFLSDLPLREDTPFEDWLVSEREQLRERAINALRLLVESYLARSEYRLGIQHAQRLVALDPLSEEGHRYLMRLFASAGRRGRAIRHYQDLKSLLHRELEVEPSEETDRLFQQILTEESPVVIDGDESDPIGPVIPLVGRASAMADLSASWDDVRKRHARMTCIAGESGVGKTRLTRAFLDVASSQQPVTVVMGSCIDGRQVAYQPFPKIVRRAIDETVADGDGSVTLPSQMLAELALLVPDLASEHPDLPPATTRPDNPKPLFEAIVELILVLIRRSTEASEPDVTPVILYLDDLDWAGPETARLVTHLLKRLEDQPVWIVATCREHRALTSGFPPFNVVELERLDAAAVEEIAAGIVAGDQRSEFVSLLIEHRHGLPMGIAEMINFLWDEAALVAGQVGHWHLEIDPGSDLLQEVTSIEEMIARRLRRLPSSTRRIATLAAVIGQEFQPELVRCAAREHVAVIDIGMEVLLERWLVRPYAEQWASGGRLAQKATPHSRHSRFDFTHRCTRQAIYQSISPSRRQFIHGQIVDAFEELFGADAGLHCELLSFHCIEAHAWNRALIYLDQTLHKAEATAAHELAARCRTLLEDILQRIPNPAGIDPAEKARSST